MTSDPDKLNPHKRPRLITFIGIIILIGIGVFAIYALFDRPEARLRISESVYFNLNETNHWTGHKAIIINYPMKIGLYPELHTKVSINVPEALKNEKKATVENILIPALSSDNIDPQRLDIFANASMLNMQNERTTLNGIISIIDKNKNIVSVIDVIIDIKPLPNYGIYLNPTSVHLILNHTGNSTDHELVSIENPLQQKLKPQIRAINASLQSNFEEAISVKIYPQEYSQKISIDAYNIATGPNRSQFLPDAGGSRTYYGYIEISLEDGRIVGVIDLKIDVIQR